MFDISERERAELANRDAAIAVANPDRRHSIVDALASVAERFLSGRSTDGDVLRMLASLGQALGVDRVAVLQNERAEDDAPLLVPLYDWVAPGIGSQPPLTDIPFDPARRDWQRRLSAGDPIVGHVRDFPPEEASFLTARHVLSIALVPVFAREDWWGAIAFGQCISERAWSDADLRVLRAAAAMVGADVERRRSEAAFQETEDRYRRMVEASPDAIVVHRSGVITYANPAAARLVGASGTEEVIGRSILEFIHPDSRPKVLTRLQRLREGKSVPPIEERFVRLDGTAVDVEVAATPFMVDGEAAVQIVARDVTDRRRAEEAVRESEARKSSILQSALDGVITMDDQGRIVEFNPAAEEMFGHPRDQVMGALLADLLIPPELRQRHRRAVARHLATGETSVLGRRVETMGLRADGSRFPLELAVTRVDLPGPALFTAYIRDITDARRAQEALRDSEERYRRLVERSPDAIAVHVGGRLVFANRATAWLVGAKSAEELIGRPISEVIHPGDSPRGPDRAVPDGDQGRDAPVRQEKLVRLDGSVIDVEVSSIPFTYMARPAGQVVIRDITDRKRAEVALRQRGEYMAALHETALGLMNRLDLRDLLEAIVTRAASLLDTGDGAIYLAHPEEGELELHVGTGVFAGWIGDRIERGEGMLGRIWDSGRISRIDDYATWPDRMEGGRYDVLHAGLAAPLTYGSQFLGIIGVARTEPGRTFDQDDQALLEQFARLASIALDNARLYAEAQDQLREREWAEQQLREAEAKFRNLVERTPAITYTVELGETARWLYVSPQIEVILGFTPEEWIATPDMWSAQLHPEDREEILALARQSLETGEPVACEYRLLAKDERAVWVRDESAVVWGATGRPVLQGVMLDITERKHAEEKLRGAEARYRTLVEQIPAITYIDSFEAATGEYRTTYVSPQIEQMLGYSAEEFTSPDPLWPSLIHPEDRERVLATDHRHYATGEPLGQEYRLIARDGRVVWVLDEAVAVRDGRGSLRFSQGILYDITERRRVEEGLERALDIERQATERLRALDELKNTFLHAVSHELRTPLAAVLGFALTLEREEVQLATGERMEIARRLAANARKLDQLLSDLLDLDRLDRGIAEPRRKPTDVAALVRRVVENSEVLGTRPVRVEARLVVAPVDGPKVERIVENLLVNAARHTPPGSTIWVGVGPHEGGVLLTVEDEGTGVPEHLREMIFEPFRQGPEAPAHSPGVGIGLSLVARFAVLHGGQAWVEDRPEGGASFKVFLPGGSV